MRRDASYPSPSMRVSDAERTEAAERLSKHYGDGRLDEAEFNRRLDQAMNAKTHADFQGLFDDLPPAEAPAPAPRERQRRHVPRLLALVLLIVLASALWHATVHMFFVPWLLIILIAFLLLRRYTWHGHRGP